MKLKRIPFNGFWNIDLVQFEAFAPAPNRLNIQFTLYRDSIDTEHAELIFRLVD